MVWIHLQKEHKDGKVKGNYPGVDDYKDITLKKGKIIYAGDPYPTGYATTESALKRTGNDATKIFEGLQVGHGIHQRIHSLSGYKQTLMPYEMMEDIPAAFGTTKANPHFGSGGLPQVYVDKFNDLVKAGRIRPIPDKKIPLKNWHVKPDDVKGIYSRVPKPSKEILLMIDKNNGDIKILTNTTINKSFTEQNYNQMI